MCYTVCWKSSKQRLFFGSFTIYIVRKVVLLQSKTIFFLNFKSIVIENVVTTGNGLYEEVQINPNGQDSVHTVYVFKGDNVNNYIRRERFYGDLKRSFYIGLKRNTDIKALYKDGILTISFPKEDIQNENNNNIKLS